LALVDVNAYCFLSYFFKVAVLHSPTRGNANSEAKGESLDTNSKMLFEHVKSKLFYSSDKSTI